METGRSKEIEDSLFEKADGEMRKLIDALPEQTEMIVESSAEEKSCFNCPSYRGLKNLGSIQAINCARRTTSSPPANGSWGRSCYAHGIPYNGGNQE